MSADNGIYIAKFPDGYRVCYGQAIGNVDYYPAGSKERKAELRAYFGWSHIYSDRRDAIMAAHDMAAGCEVLEYGVRELGEYEAFDA